MDVMNFTKNLIIVLNTVPILAIEKTISFTVVGQEGCTPSMGAAIIKMIFSYETFVFIQSSYLPNPCRGCSPVSCLSKKKYGIEQEKSGT